MSNSNRLGNVMLDLEMMGLGAGCQILSIGAVEFDAGVVGAKFYVDVSLDGQEELGLRTDASTAEWWSRQSEEARAAVFGSRNAVSLRRALIDFAEWFPEGAKIWAKGSDFDVAALAYAYRCVDQEVPWNFRNVRCMRTLMAMFPNISEPAHVGIAHNAKYDALNQAHHAATIMWSIKEAQKTAFGIKADIHTMLRNMPECL